MIAQIQNAQGALRNDDIVARVTTDIGYRSVTRTLGTVQALTGLHRSLSQCHRGTCGDNVERMLSGSSDAMRPTVLTFGPAIV